MAASGRPTEKTACRPLEGLIVARPVAVSSVLRAKAKRNVTGAVKDGAGVSKARAIAPEQPSARRVPREAVAAKPALQMRPMAFAEASSAEALEQDAKPALPPSSAPFGAA